MKLTKEQWLARSQAWEKCAAALEMADSDEWNEMENKQDNIVIDFCYKKSAECREKSFDLKRNEN